MLSSGKLLKADSGEFLELRDPSGNHCGTYFVDNPFKPYLAAVCTPSGQSVVDARPPDPRHHHGLQFGLCADDVNFWEEDLASEPDDFRVPIGWQQSLKLERLTGTDGDGLHQELLWCHETYTGTCVTFREERLISVRHVAPRAYVWTWQTTLTAARDVRLVMSAWPQASGYCGVGLRLAPELFSKRSSVSVLPDEGCLCGSVPSSVLVRGTHASVSLHQDTSVQQDVLYVQGCTPGSSEPYAWLGLGPTNGGPRSLHRGDTLRRSYQIAVHDA